MSIRPRRPHRLAGRAVVIAGLLLGVFALPVQGSDAPEFDRPGWGFAPAALQAGGVIWEQALPDWSRRDRSAIWTADALLRVGVGGPFELQLGTSYAHLSAPGQHVSGRGPSSIGVKFAGPGTGDLSWGVLGNITLTDGARAFADDRRAYLLGTALTWQLDARNALGTYLETVRSGGRNDYLLALNAGRALSDAVGVYLETAWQRAADEGAGTLAGAGLTWMITPRAQFDASVRHRLNGAADVWQAGLGLSIYFGKL